METTNLVKLGALSRIIVLLRACRGSDLSRDVTEANSLQSMNGGRQSEASDDKVRILDLQGKGGSFSVLPCTTYNLMTGEKETCDQEQWQMVQDADIVRWEDCAFGRHGLGGFVSHVTIVLDDESWHTVYVYDKNVC